MWTDWAVTSLDHQFAARAAEGRFRGLGRLGLGAVNARKPIRAFAPDLPAAFLGQHMDAGRPILGCRRLLDGAAGHQMKPITSGDGRHHAGLIRNGALVLIRPHPGTRLRCAISRLATPARTGLPWRSGLSDSLRSRGRYLALAEIVMCVARHDGEPGSGVFRRIVHPDPSRLRQTKRRTPLCVSSRRRRDRRTTTASASTAWRFPSASHSLSASARPYGRAGGELLRMRRHFGVAREDRRLLHLLGQRRTDGLHALQTFWVPAVAFGGR